MFGLGLIIVFLLARKFLFLQNVRKYVKGSKTKTDFKGINCVNAIDYNFIINK